MNKLTMLLLTTLLLSIAACTRTETVSDALTHEEGGHEEHADQAAKGPHGGRLLSDEHFEIEVTIYESGVPPEYRVYAYMDDKPIAPNEVTAKIELQRFGGRKDVFTFTSREDYLLGSSEVEEPHSFDVTVTAEYAGKQHTWSYESHEGRTSIVADMAKAAGVEIATAGPGVLRETIELYGSINANAERVRNITARYPGVIRTLSKNLGDRVNAGETLATIESNESLQTYSVTAPISGLITQRHANVGEATDATPLFVISDFSSVWAELSVFPRDRARLATGQSVSIKATDGKAADTGRIGFIAPTGQDNQGLLARVTLDNQDGRWTPGQFVTGAVTVAETKVPVAIPVAALQTFRDWNVVFLNDGETYQAMPLELGRRDSTTVEVLSGLPAGQRYVSSNSYLIKADIEKSGASHDH